MNIDFDRFDCFCFSLFWLHTLVIHLFAVEVIISSHKVKLWSRCDQKSQTVSGVALTSVYLFSCKFVYCQTIWVCLWNNRTPTLSYPQGENRKCFVAKSLIAEVKQLLQQKHFYPKMLATWHVSLSWSWSGLSFLPVVLNRSIFMELFRKKQYVLHIYSVSHVSPSKGEIPFWLTVFSTYFA